MKWKKLTAADKFRKYQCVLEPLVQDLMYTFSNSSKNGDEVNSIFISLTEAMQRVAKTLPHYRFRKNLKPYWSEELDALKLRKVQSYRVWVAADRPRGYDNRLYCQYKRDKKVFHASIKKLAKEYENREIIDAVKTAELNRNAFWRNVSTARKGQVKGLLAIKRPDETVVHELKNVLKVCADHFASIGTPKMSEHYKEHHFKTVTNFVKEYNTSIGLDDFFDREFTFAEEQIAVRTLHTGKAPGFDEVMTEHLLFAGPLVIELLRDLYNAVRVNGCIPECFKRGVQIPLYKGCLCFRCK